MPRGNTGLNETTIQAVRPRSERLAAALAWLANISFILYLVLLLGANSQAASGGPLAWWPLWQLPASDGGWAGVGVVSLLPLLSAVSWLAARGLTGQMKTLAWRPNRVTWPLLCLAALAALSLARQCAHGCSVGNGLRLALLLGHLAWVYLYSLNERPPLFSIIVAAIALQSTIALGQFVAQRDLGLRFLGEPALDPAVAGISVVMRAGERWLRAYGLTAHPNVLAGSLVPLLLALPARGRPPSALLRGIVPFVFGLGGSALLATLSRWALVCFALGLAINGLPSLAAALRPRRPASASPAISRGTWLALLLSSGLFLAVYGDAALGRAVNLETHVESRSLWERERDINIALRLVAENPLSGVGLGQYLPAARQIDAWAEAVHNVPLWLAAELGVGGALIWFWLLLAPVARRGAFSRFAPLTGLWLGFWLLGLFQPAPHPLNDLRSVLLIGLVAALMTLSIQRAAGHDLPNALP